MENGKKTILSVDLGYSSVKTAYRDENGALTLAKEISAVACLPDSTKLDDESTGLFEFCGKTYALGSTALKVPRSYLLPMTTWEELKNCYPVWVSHLIERFGGLESIDHMVIGISLAFKDRADELLEYLYETLLIEKKDFFICLPQGLACKKVYGDLGANPLDPSRKNDYRMANYLILDGGHASIDGALITNSKSATTSTIGLMNTGTIRISQAIADWIYKNLEIRISLREAQVIVETNSLIRRGREYDFKKQVDYFCKEYLKSVLQLVEEKFGEALDSVEGILMCGGLSYYMKKYMTDPEMVKEIEAHFPLAFIKLAAEGSSEYFNAISYLKFAEGLIEQGKI